MNKNDRQLNRLLRAAAVAPPPAAGELPSVPDASYLLRERERELTRAENVNRSVFRVGLATACALLMVTLLVSWRQIEQANQDVFAASQVALTRISTP